MQSKVDQVEPETLGGELVGYLKRRSNIRRGDFLFGRSEDDRRMLAY